MVKLTDTHRVILTEAGGRDRALVLPFPKSLKLTPAKAEPIVASLIKLGVVAEIAVADGEPLWRTDETLGRLTLVATAAGLKLVGIVPLATEPPPAPRAEPKAKSRRAAGSGSSSSIKARHRLETPKAPRPTSKLAILIAALKGKKGATLPDLTKATGWQPHSVRGAMSGALKKKLGLVIDSSVIESRGRVYRIVE